MNLPELLAQDSHPLRRESADSWCGPCPKCGGVDRFVVKGERWWCRQCEPRGGDAIDYLRRARGLTYL